MDNKHPLKRVAEAAEWLSVSRSKVYQLMDSQLLPYVKLGRSRRLRLEDLEKLVERNIVGESS